MSSLPRRPVKRCQTPHQSLQPPPLLESNSKASSGHQDHSFPRHEAFLRRLFGASVGLASTYGLLPSCAHRFRQQWRREGRDGWCCWAANQVHTSCHVHGPGTCLYAVWVAGAPVCVRVCVCVPQESALDVCANDVSCRCRH